MKKNKKNAKCQKFVDSLVADQKKEFDAAHMESVINGCAFLLLTPDMGIKHIPMEAITKGLILNEGKKST